MNIVNFFDFFIEHYEKTPNKVSLILYPETENPKIFTFKEIYQRISSLQVQLKKYGIEKSSRVVLLSEPDENFYFLSLALIALGATPVFLEAKREGFLRRLASTSFDAILLDPKLDYLKYLIPHLWFKTVFSFGRKMPGLKKLHASSLKETVTVACMSKEDPLLISFTTGSTGKQKAADRNYTVSYNQHTISMKYWIHKNCDVDLTFFPNILFQNLSSGVTTLVPKMRVSNLDSFPFEKISSILEKYKVTRLSIPPGYLNALIENTSTPINSIKKVISGGAPIDQNLAQKTLDLFPKAECNVVYGSTEAEPISSFNMEKLIGSSEINVGTPIEEIDLKIDFENDESRGEILISGPHVVKKYLNNDVDNSVFKVIDTDGTIWHRTGDVGSFNSKGELILSGRKKYAFQTKKGIRYSLELENLISDRMPSKSRCAIVKMKNFTLLVIESKKLNIQDLGLAKENASKTMSSYFETYKISFMKRLPVDSRHHWKFDYIKIKELL